MASRQPQKFTHSQPRTYSLNYKAVLSFPFRLCNPPPAVGKVRSCGVTPLLNLRLEDVLNRQHLPPLGLKDFEEWLLFVELSPENLYFTLWLREYKQRYRQWKSQAAFQSKNAPSGFHINSSSQYSSQLAMFYTRAKQTFFTPGSEYELNLSSNLLAPFDQPNLPPHPDPELFVEVELETLRMLDDSLRRFVHAQLNNAGNNRVACGAVAGIFFSLLGSIPPLALNFTRGHDRWSRMAAIPALWIGLTIFLSAMNGICIGVYIFGDLRQLRKFELARPVISKPQPLPGYRHRSTGAARPVSIPNSILPMQQPRKFSTQSSHHQHDFPLNTLHRMPSISSTATRESQLTSQVSSSDDNIQISPAYYDADEVDISAIYDDQYSSYRFPDEKVLSEHQQRINSINGPDGNSNTPGDTNGLPARPLDSTFTSTATFIHPFDFANYGEEDEETALERSTQLPEQHQRMYPFDFDSLPPRNMSHSDAQHPDVPIITFPHPQPNSYPQHPLDTYQPSSSSRTTSPPTFPPAMQLKMPDPRAPPPAVPTSFLARLQEKCNIAKWRLQTGYLEAESPYPGDASGAPHPSSPYWSSHPNSSSMRMGQNQGKRPSSDSDTTAAAVSVDGTDASEKKAKKRFRMMNAVPAFAVPLTRVLSPVIVRGQWDIVIRSALVSFIIACTLIGSLLAVPVVRRGQ